MQPGGYFAQRIVKEYKIKNSSQMVLQKFRSRSILMQIYDHHEGKLPDLVGDLVGSRIPSANFAELL